jgi:hypothetical protein
LPDQRDDLAVTFRRPASPAGLASSAVVAWAIALLLGFTVILLDVEPGGRVNVGRAIFTAVDAATLTGLTPAWRGVHDGGPTGWAVLMLTVAGLIASVVVGGSAFAALAGHDRVPRVQAVVAGMLAFGVMVVALGPVQGMRWVATLAGTGVLAGMSGATIWLGLPVSLVGVLLPLACGATRRQVRWSVIGMAVVFVGSAFVLLVVTGSMVEAVKLAMDGRSAGFTASEGVTDLPAPARWAMVPLILTGTSAGGTGAGVGVVTLLVLTTGVTTLLRGGSCGRLLGIAFVWVTTVAVLFGLTFLSLIALLPGMPDDRVAILAAGCVSNVGVSVGPVSAAGGDAYVMSVAMLLGRVLPWGVLWWCVVSGDEDVLVG